MEKSEMGGADSTCGERRGGKEEERRQFGNPGVDGRIILRWTLRKGVELHGLE
jgi:hypothetical protein